MPNAIETPARIEPAAFICWLYQEFYRDAPAAMLEIRGRERSFVMTPGAPDFPSAPPAAS